MLNRHCLTLLLSASLILFAVADGANAATVSGFVYSESDGEALEYASVHLTGTSFGDLTNEKGFFVITGVPPGTYEIVFGLVGFAPLTRNVDLSEEVDSTITVELRTEAIELEEIEVSAERQSALVLEPSKLTLQTRELTHVPPVVEVDLFRAVQSLPGVSTLSDFSSGLYVRGGSADQNLILLDDVDVYNPSHLFGFFSTFNVDAVKTVDLQKSGYPARYGGRLSSVLDVHNRDGNRKEFEAVGRLSLIGSTITLEGPWRRGSWMIAGRHTHLETLAKAADLDLPYRFYDIHGKLNYDVGKYDRTSLSLFRGSDRLDWDQKTLDVILDWGNDTFSAQWTHLFSSRLFSHFLIGGSRFHSEAIVRFQDLEFKSRNQIDDISLKGNLSHAPSANHLIDFGTELKLLDFSWKRSIGDEDQLTFKYDGLYGAVYGQDSWKISDEWQFQPGLRLDYYSEGDYLHLGPRLTLRRKLQELTSLHFAYGRYYQYLNLVSEEGASFADMWFPVDETLDPGKADQYILGVDIGPYEHFDLSIEGYYKSYGNLVEFDDEFGASLIEEDAELGEAFLSGDGDAFGIDFYLRNRVKGFEGWVGYSLGSTEREIPGFNFGKEYYPSYDRRHQIVIMQEKQLGKGFRLNFNFRYGSGQPTTLGAGRYTVRDVTGREFDVILPGDFNESRLPDYHRLDIGISYLNKSKDWSIEPTLQIINLYNHENVYIRYYDTTENPAKFEDVTMLPFLPTIGINVRF